MRVVGLRLSEKQIAILSCALALVALVLLFLALRFAEPREIAIGSLAFENENALVSFSGKVDSIELSEGGNAKMRVCEGGACASVSFSASRISPAFAKGEQVIVVGTVRSYKGAKFVSAAEIRGGGANG